MQFEAIVFDLDGTLIDSETLACRAWQEAAAEQGYEIPHEIYVQAIGRTVADTRRIFTSFLAPEFPYSEIRARRVEITNQIIERDGVPLKKGARELLIHLSDIRMPCALATSTYKQSAEWKLDLLGFRQFFKAFAFGDEIERGKPNPDIYLLAAERMGVQPEKCLAIEDSGPGIEAAKSAGMSVVYVEDLAPVSDDIRVLARRSFASLMDVQTCFASPSGFFSEKY